jgi:hypothetical protein
MAPTNQKLLQREYQGGRGQPAKPWALKCAPVNKLLVIEYQLLPPVLCSVTADTSSSPPRAYLIGAGLLAKQAEQDRLA